MRLTDEGYIDDEEVVAPSNCAIVVEQLPLQDREGEHHIRVSCEREVVLTTDVLFIRARS